MGWKHTAYHIINSDPGHTLSKQQLDKYLKKKFASSFKSTDEKETKKKEKKGKLQRTLRYTQTQKVNHNIGSCKYNFSIKKEFWGETRSFEKYEVLRDFKEESKNLGFFRSF